MAGDVLETRQEKRIVVRTMAVMAHEGARRALWMIVLAAAEPIIDEQQCATNKRTGQGAYQSRHGQADFTHIGRHRRQLSRTSMQNAFFQWSLRPRECTAIPSHTAFHDLRLMPCHDVYRQRIEDFICEYDASQLLGNRVEPMRATA